MDLRRTKVDTPVKSRLVQGTKSRRIALFTKMAMEKGRYTRRFSLSGAKSTFLVIERLIN